MNGIEHSEYPSVLNGKVIVHTIWIDSTGISIGEFSGIVF